MRDNLSKHLAYAEVLESGDLLKHDIVKLPQVVFSQRLLLRLEVLLVSNDYLMRGEQVCPPVASLLSLLVLSHAVDHS